jgi:hypothetical protein
LSATIVDGTVRRPAGPWTASLHALLRHFESVGGAGAPRALGMQDGVEVLSYVGERSYDPADSVVGTVGRLVVAPASYWVPLRTDEDAARHGMPANRRGKRLRLLLDGYGLDDRDGFLELVAAVWHSCREAYRVWGGVERRERWADAFQSSRCEYIDANLAWLERHRTELEAWL